MKFIMAMIRARKIGVNATSNSVAAGRDIRDSVITVNKYDFKFPEEYKKWLGERTLPWIFTEDLKRPSQIGNCPLTLEVVQAWFYRTMWYKVYDVFIRNESDFDVLLTKARIVSHTHLMMGDGASSGTVLPTESYALRYEINRAVFRQLSPPFEIKSGDLCCIRFELLPETSNEDTTKQQEVSFTHSIDMSLVDSRDRFLPIIEGDERMGDSTWPIVGGTP